MHLFKCLTLWVTAARVQHNGISLEIDGTDSMEQFRDLNELNSVRPVRCCIMWFIWFYISLYSRYGSVLVEILGAAIESTEQVCVCVWVTLLMRPVVMLWSCALPARPAPQPLTSWIVFSLSWLFAAGRSLIFITSSLNTTATQRTTAFSNGTEERLAHKQRPALLPEKKKKKKMVYNYSSHYSPAHFSSSGCCAQKKTGGWSEKWSAVTLNQAPTRKERRTGGRDARSRT